MRAWGFWTLDPERDGLRLELVAELAASEQPERSPARLLLRSLDVSRSSMGDTARAGGSVVRRRRVAA